MIVYSFDVFDTLISRKTGTHKGVFAAVQEALQNQLDDFPHSGNFFNLRIQAELDARTKSIYEDVTFDEIYRELADKTQDLKFCSIAKKLELSLERHYSFGVSENIELVRSLLNEGERVILISDMYLPEKEIKSLISRCAPDIAEKCTLYVSGVLRKTKSSGTLFRHVVQQENIQFSDLAHVGDNPRSDFEVPKSLGVQCTHFTRAQLRSWEDLSVSEADLMHQKVAGLARQYRLSGHSLKRCIGYSVVGPILGGYATWLLTKAKEHQFKKLFLLARDGYLVDEMICELQKEELDPVETVYVYGSRLAWQKTCLSKLTEPDIDRVLFSFTRNTVRSVAKRLGIEPDELRKYCPELQTDQRLSSKQLRTLRHALTDPGLIKRIENIATRNRHLLLVYLGKLGVFDESEVAVVDIGWNGSMQNYLFKIAQQQKHFESLVGLYFGLTAERHRLAQDKSCVHSFEQENVGDFQFCHDAKFFEILASAPHGSTIGYREDEDGNVVPILDEQGKKLEDWGYSELADGALDFVRENATLLKSTSDRPFWCQFAKDYLAYLKSDRVCKEFAECLGSYPFTPDSDDQGMLELAPRLTTKQALSYPFFSPQQRAEVTLWPRGSAMRSSRLTQIILGNWIQNLFRYVAKPWYLYEFLPYSVVMRLIRWTPKPIVRFMQRKIYGVKIH